MDADVFDLIIRLGELVADTLTILGILLATYVALTAGRITYVQRLILFGPIRRGTRPVRKQRLGTTRREARAAARTARYYLIDALLGSTVEPAVFVQQQLRDAPNGSIISAARSLEVLQLLCVQASNPGRQGALGRTLWPDATALTLNAIRRLRDFLDEIEALQLQQQKRSEFATFVSSYSGAYVLADGALNRSAVIDNVIVWHRQKWVGPEDPHPRDPALITFDKSTPWTDRHVGFDMRSMKAIPGEDGRRGGDYDGRILDLEAVIPMSNTRTDESALVLETRESCYNVSELSPKWRSKHLPSNTTPPASYPRFEPAEGGGRRRSDQDIAVLLNTALTLVSIPPRGAAGLILARRSMRNRNANGVLSTAAGGVIDAARPGRRGDMDELGRIDVNAAVRRETLEELGLLLDSKDVSAVAVHQANVQGRTASHCREAGELTATVSFLAFTSLTSDELTQARATRSDWSRGRFEADDLITVPIGLSGSSRPDELARTFCQSLADIAREIDQKALIGALYAVGYLYGYDQVMSALQASDLAPWWRLAWSGEQTTPRVVMNPSDLWDADDQRLAARLCPDWVVSRSSSVGGGAME